MIHYDRVKKRFLYPAFSPVASLIFFKTSEFESILGVSQVLEILMLLCAKSFLSGKTCQKLHEY